MAIILIAITLAVRFLAPHEVFRLTYPFVPVGTVLMALAATVGVLRKKIALYLPTQIILQFVLLAWIATSLAVNQGVSVAISKTLGGNFPRDIFFIIIVVLVVDRASRLKVLIASMVLSFVVIGIFGLPQLWGPRMCAEWKEGNMDDLVFDTRKCADTPDCAFNQPKERVFPGVGSRLYRCERRGPFNIAAYFSRLRWPGTFTNVNNLAATAVLVAPIFCGWYASRPKHRRRWFHRLLFPIVAGLLIAVVFATASRAGQLGLGLGLGLLVWRLWGNKVTLIAGVLVLAVVAVSMGRLKIRDDLAFYDAEADSTKHRTAAMWVGFRIWREFPVFGVGQDNFVNFNLIGPHNAYLAVASETGTPGLYIFMLSLWFTFKCGWRVRSAARKSGNEALSRLALGVLGGVLGGVVAFTMFLSNYSAINLLLAHALGSGLLRAAKAEMPDLKLGFSYWDLLGALVAMLLLMGALYLGLSVYFTVKGFPFEFMGLTPQVNW